MVSGMGEPKRRDSLCLLKELDCLLTRPQAVDVAAVPFQREACTCGGLQRHSPANGRHG